MSAPRIISVPMENEDKILRSAFRSESDYRRAEQWWRDFWAQIPGSALWMSPWLNTSFADGTPMLDGDGILSAKCPAIGRAFKVIHEQDDDVRGRIIWWKKTWDPEEENLTVLDVVIVPSAEALEAIKEILSAWATGGDVDDRGDREFAG